MFVNEAQPKSDDTHYRGGYGYNHPPKLLFLWSRLLQSVISQAGTYLLTGKFHSRHCAIYKCEGGCVIAGVGDLVLGERGCYFDFRGDEESDKKARQLSALITDIVLNWNPNEPVDSMLNAAAVHIKVDVVELKKAVENSNNGGVFGGNALSSFFDWNPFSFPPIDRDYQKWCLINFDNKTPEQVDQMHADEDLGRALLERINKVIKERSARQYPHTALCCAPSRTDDGELQFWINTGCSTQLDGWKSQAQIEAFLASDEKLVDSRGF